MAGSWFQRGDRWRTDAAGTATIASRERGKEVGERLDGRIRQPVVEADAHPAALRMSAQIAQAGRLCLGEEAVAECVVGKLETGI